MIVHVPISIINFSVISNLTQHFLLNSFFFFKWHYFFSFQYFEKVPCQFSLGNWQNKRDRHTYTCELYMWGIQSNVLSPIPVGIILKITRTKIILFLSVEYFNFIPELLKLSNWYYWLYEKINTYIVTIYSSKNFL